MRDPCAMTVLWGKRRATLGLWREIPTNPERIAASCSPSGASWPYQRSAPVPGRSSVRPVWHHGKCRDVTACGPRCAQGRAHSCLVTFSIWWLPQDAPLGVWRILTLPPADDSVSLSSFGGEGWGEEAVTPGGSCCRCLQRRLCPSPRAPLARRGRNTRWQCQGAPIRV